MIWNTSVLFASLWIAGAALALARLVLHLKRRSPLAYPPGPKVESMPAHDLWVHYRNWGRDFGKLVYLQGENILILNHSQDAIELLEKRSRMYSDRRISAMAELCGTESIISLARYSDNWRRNRKLFQQNFRQATIDRFHPIQYDKVHEFLRELIKTPDMFMRHTMALSQRVVFSALYGFAVNPEDPIAQRSAGIVHSLGLTLMPGSFQTVNRFPWLRALPSWFPGCGFKRKADQFLKDLKKTDTIPFDMTIDKMNKGEGISLIAELASKSEGNQSEIEAIKAMGTTSFLAASDTTKSSVSSFLLTMVLHPEVQTKAQEEIDRVIGRHRLPTLEDRLSLPYIQAIYREVMRLHPPLPLGHEHSLINDDVYLGYHIPKGCSVIPNIWAMSRDPDVYAQPDDFIPERFLDDPTGPFTNVNNILAYGFGRRVCIGKFMADNTVWLTIASVLATLRLGKPKDKDGNEIPIEAEFTDFFFRHPKPFQCSIAPRHPEAEKLIFATTNG